MKKKISKSFYLILLKPLFLMLIILTICANTFSQSFLPAYEPTIGYKKGFVVLKDCTKIEGTFKLINNTKNIKNCTIEDENKKKYSLKAQQIEKVYISLSGWDKMSSYNEFTLSFQELMHFDFKELFTPRYFVWEHTIDKENGKEKVLQLVNPGFDSRIKVFRNPSAIQEGGDQYNIGEDMSYYVMKTGTDIATKIKKKDYPEQFMNLFGDCPELIEALKGKKPQWDHFASHVFIYDQFKN